MALQLPGTNTQVINVAINATVNNFMQGTNQVINQTNRLNTSLASIGGTMTKFVSAPLLAIGALFIKTASDVQEATSKFNVVFGDSANEVRAWSENLSESVNRSKYDIQKFASEFQDTLVPLGFANDKATELSKSLTQLAIDLGSFNNQSSAEVAKNLGSAMVGNTEAVRSYGIVLTQARIEQYALSTGIIETKRQLTNLEKSLVISELLFKDSAFAIGDAERTADSFANQMEKLKGDLKDVAVAFGEELLPLATEAVKGLGDLAESFANMSEGGKKAVLAFAGIAIAIGPVLTIISQMTIAFSLFSTTILPNITSAMVKLNSTFIPFLSYGALASGMLAGVALTAVGVAGALGSIIVEMNRVNEGFENFKTLYDNGILSEKGAEEISDFKKQLVELSDEAKESGYELIGYYEETLNGQKRWRVGLQATENAVSKNSKAYEELAKKGKNIQIVYDETFGTLENLRKGLEDETEYTIKLAEATKLGTEALEKMNIQREKFIAVRTAIVDAQKQEADSLNSQRDAVLSQIESFSKLASMKNRSATQESLLLTLQQKLTKQLGQNVAVYNNEGKIIGSNIKSIENYILSIENLIKAKRAETVVGLLLDEKQIKSEIEKATSEKIKATKKYFDAIANGAPPAVINAFKNSLTQQTNLINDLFGSLDANKKLQSEINKDLTSDFNKYTDLVVSNIKTTGNDVISTQKDVVQEAIQLSNYRYQTEKINAKQYSEELKKILASNTKYFKDNLNAELSLRQQIFQLEKQIEEERIKEQSEILQKANEQLKKELEAKEEFLEKSHQKRLDAIKTERDARINAINAEYEAQERLVNESRLQDRLEEINSVIDAYKASTSASGQQQYRDLVQEREDIRLQLLKSSTDAEVDAINAKYDYIEQKENERYEQDKANIEASKTTLETKYTEMVNKLTGVTETASTAIQTKVDAVKKSLSEDLPALIGYIADQITNIPVPTFEYKVPTTIDFSQFELGVPAQASLNGNTYNITNNVNMFNTFNVNGAEDGATISVTIAEQIRDSLKGV